MGIRLKDRDFEKKLNEQSNGCFSKALNESIFYDFGCDFEPFYTVKFSMKFGDKTRLVNMVFKKSEVEEVPEYTPNAWNNYPEVDPPEDVLMRVEYDFVEEDHEGDPLTTVRVYESGRYHRGHWFNANGDAELFCESFDEERVSNFRFRPWED